MSVFVYLCSSARMRYVAAYLLAVLGGNNAPKAKDLKQILSSVAVDVDDDSLSKVIKELEGKDLEELIAEGKLIRHISFS